MTDETIFFLRVDEVPPSTNTIYRTTGKNGRTRTYTTRSAKEFKQRLNHAAKNQIKTPTSKPLTVVVLLSFPDRRKRDLDNYAKTILDALNGTVWKDDSQIQKLIIEKRHTPGNRSTSVIVIQRNEEI
ncbi:RusA family crossover junction endodeoxyribonuclease [Candidatus Woesearchaeota archaeon]|nr:MAG: RusA family crossover junction endodeoxyribonuclease [Candidatus Woesearchaeota archaeon]